MNYLEENFKNNVVGTKTTLIDNNGKKLKDFFYIPSQIKNFNKMVFDNFLPHSSVMIVKLACSSVVERYVDIVEVISSILITPTNHKKARF